MVGQFDATIGVDNRTRLDVLPQVSVAKDTTVHTAASAATSEVTMRIQDTRSNGAWITWGAFPGEQLLTRYIVPLQLPGRLIHYFSAAPGLLWSPFAPADGGFPSGGQADDTYRPYRPGQNLVVDWNRYPLHPQPDFVAGAEGPQIPLVIPSAIRTGNTLTLTRQ